MYNFAASYVNLLSFNFGLSGTFRSSFITLLREYIFLLISVHFNLICSDDMVSKTHQITKAEKTTFSVIFLSQLCFNGIENTTPEMAMRCLTGSVVTVVEFHSVADEIEYIFASK